MSRTVVAIGNFDGVHRGHQAILRAATEAAQGAPVVAVTFWPHPISVLRPAEAPLLLTELPDRIRLLKQAGADQVRVVQFTAQMSGWSPEQFLDAVIRPLEPKLVVVGENFRFGKGAAADGQTLSLLGRGSFGVVVLPMLSDEAPLSSSRVRQALADGDAGQAAWMLGRWFRFAGIVVQGDQRGRQLGYPTANLLVPPDHACPADGVYAGWLAGPAALAGSLTSAAQSPLRRSLAPTGPAAIVRDGEIRWPAAISVGTNPTFGAVERRVEAHALGETDLDLYGQRVGVDFVERLRPMRRFAGLDELTAQLRQDVVETRRVLLRTGDTWRLGAPAPASARTPD